MTPADDLKTTPFWWEAAPRPRPESVELPQSVDCLVVGSGYTGICTALVLARAGRSVLVCEAGAVGYGASTRNGGLLGPSFHKLGVQGLKARYGTARTYAILRESLGFVDFVQELIEAEGINCDFRRNGRFRCASRPQHYDAMARGLDELVAATGLEAEMLPRSRVREEIGSEAFFGGTLYHRDGCLHPGRYHDGLLRSATEAGVAIASHTAVDAIARTRSGYTVQTSAGTVLTGQLAVCTNGYTRPVTQQFRRRLLPIRSAMIATEALPEDVMQRLMPKRRVYGDSRRVMAYYRPSPDGQRILFGGRSLGYRGRPESNARHLRGAMLKVFPDLDGVRLTHSWSGLVAYTFDHAPHIGCEDGLHYAMGYCGSGVARASYFGTKLGHRMLDDGQGETAFDDLPFEGRPLYTGRPWFMPAVLNWHQLLERLGR